MKAIEKLLQLGLLAALVALLPAPLFADDSEIFFAPVAAGDNENKPSANVMLLLDTSGSMRWCEDEEWNGTGRHRTVKWCATYATRRINMLVAAVNALIDGAQDGVRVGVSRFQSDGGKILVPVVDLTPSSKAVLKAEVAALNSEGNNTSGFGEGSPSGGTPTAEAFTEVARYMMGMSTNYASSADRSVCVALGEEEYNCRDVFRGYTDFVELVSPATCDSRLETWPSSARQLGRYRRHL